MHGIVNLDDSIVLYSSNLLRDQILIIPTTKKKLTHKM